MSDGPAVETWTELVGAGPSIVVRYRRRCPSCAASWLRPRSVRLGGSTVGIQFWCVSCRVNHGERRRDTRPL